MDFRQELIGRNIMRRVEWIRFLPSTLVLLLVCQLIGVRTSSGVTPDKRVRPKVTVILDKLPLDKMKIMANFQDKVANYINNRTWIEENYVIPFVLGVQLFLEYSPSSVEDRYQCNILVSGPDIQYYDKRSVFAFQENEELKASGEFSPLLGLIDFYVYLVIANELDKYGPLEGAPYFDKARAVVQQGKFSRPPFFTGWDWRDEVMRAHLSENYKKFRQMKDYYFYGLSLEDDKLTEKRDYLKQAMQKLEEILKENKDNQGAKQFIDAHYQEIIDFLKRRG
jgi:hypothetical protein